MSKKINIFIPLLLIFPHICGQRPGLRQIIIQQYDEINTWGESQSICRQKHTDLIVIRNTEENQILNGYKGWIGLYQDNNTSPWKWSRGDEVANYLNWDYGEPDPDQKCAYKTDTTSKWRDDFCYFRRSYICYAERLVLVNENKTWEEALKHCRSLNKEHSYDLATLNTTDDHKFALERAQQANTEEVWTGLRYLGGEWFWVGGEPVEYQDIPSCPAASCGVLEKNSKKLFGIRDCNERRNFFCYTKA